MPPSPTSEPRPSGGLPGWARVVYLLVLLYGFLVAVSLMSASFKAFGEGSAGGLFEGVTNPFAALAVGILATVLVQSSSVTTSTIVALCGSGQLSLELAVPMIMGANIGTSVTNTMVSIGSVRRSAEFRRAFSCATVHDIFNYLAVLVLLPLELATGFLRHTAESLSGSLSFGGGGGDFKSPVKSAVKAGTQTIQGALEGLGLEGGWLATVMLAVALVLIFLCLMQITRNMRVLLMARIEASMNRVLGKSGLMGILVGAAVTVSVQSSSITTSLLVPLCAAGILTLPNAFPITIGANIGTTVTALLASTAADSNLGLTIALVHLLFNVAGTLLFYPHPALRRIPVNGARRLAVLATRSKMWLVAYLIGAFALLPGLAIVLFD